jgi:hypothetical protein
MSRIKWKQARLKTPPVFACEEDKMSVVLPFPQTRVLPRDQSACLHAAEIIIFPGVRIERRNFDLAAAMSPARNRRVSQTAIDEVTAGLT